MSMTEGPETACHFRQVAGPVAIILLRCKIGIAVDLDVTLTTKPVIAKANLA
jgi:hypothetical protein